MVYAFVDFIDIKTSIILFLYIVFSASLAVGQSGEYHGKGTAILGDGSTPAEIREIAFHRAKMDALDKSGGLIQSEMSIETTERGGRITEETKKTLKAISVGAVTTIDETRDVNRRVKGEYIEYIVSAKFSVNVKEINERFNIYNKRDNEALSSKVKKVKMYEERLEKTKGEEAQRVFRKAEDSYEYIENTFETFSGKSKYMDKVARRRLTRINNIESYCKGIFDMGFPKDVWHTEIQGEPEVVDKGGDYIDLEYSYKIQVNKKNHEEVLTFINNPDLIKSVYTEESFNDGGSLQIDILTAEAIGGEGYRKKIGAFSFSLAVIFIDERGRVLAVDKWDNGYVLPIYEHGRQKPKNEYTFIADTYSPSFSETLVSPNLHHGETSHTRSIKIPINVLKRLKGVKLVYTGFDITSNGSDQFKQLMKNNGYKDTGYGMYYNASTPIGFKKIRLTREDFDDREKIILNNIGDKRKEIEREVGIKE